MSTQTTWVPGDTFASRLVLVRRELGLSTEEIAERCGLKHQTWSTWERGATPRKMNGVVAKIRARHGCQQGLADVGRPAVGRRTRARWRLARSALDERQ